MTKTDNVKVILVSDFHEQTSSSPFYLLCLPAGVASGPSGALERRLPAGCCCPRPLPLTCMTLGIPDQP